MKLIASIAAPILLTAVALPFLAAAPSTVAPASAGAPTEAGSTYVIDGNHSSVLFRVKHMGVSNFYGTFDSVAGTVEYDAENPAKSSIEIEIAAESVDSRNPGRDDHIKSPDFLNAKEFPLLSFKSTKVVKRGENLLVTGDLTVRGVKQSMDVTVHIVGTNEKSKFGDRRVGFEAEFSIDAEAFDLAYRHKMEEQVLSHTIDLIVSLECAQS